MLVSTISYNFSTFLAFVFDSQRFSLITCSDFLRKKRLRAACVPPFAWPGLGFLAHLAIYKGRDLCYNLLFLKR